MPNSRNRKQKKEVKRVSAAYVPQEPSWFAKMFMVGEIHLMTNSFVFIFLGMYAMSKTDKLSTKTIITVDLIQASILFVMAINSGLILRAEKKKRHIKWLEQRMIFGFFCSLALFWMSNYMTLRITKYPQELENLITVKFPSLGKEAAATYSKIVTFLTSGTMALVTGIALNMLSNYLYDKVKRKK